MGTFVSVSGTDFIAEDHNLRVLIRHQKAINLCFYAIVFETLLLFSRLPAVLHIKPRQGYLYAVDIA